MPGPERKSHLKIDFRCLSQTYRYPKDLKIDFPLVARNRATHGRAIIEQLNAVREQFGIDRDQPLPENIVRDDAVYVEFFSEYNFPLKFGSLTQEKPDPDYQILTVREETIQRGRQLQSRFRVVVMMREGGISKFIEKARAYISRNTPKGSPLNAPLISNIASIQLASLRSFWVEEPEIPFPAADDIVWWEVWFRRTSDDEERQAKVVINIAGIGAQISPQLLHFPEHIIRLVRASANQLSTSLFLLDSLSELRKPQEINNFVTTPNVNFADKRAWMDDLQQRTEMLADNTVVICLLDSGVNNRHPLIQPFLADTRLYTYKGAWGTNDSWPDGGHGTGMAGLSLYGDLVQAMASSGQIRIFHSLESFKIIHEADPTDRIFYGPMTEYACSTPVVGNPTARRIFCLAVTDPHVPFFGRPSSWSSVIDKIAFGSETDQRPPQLFVISGGNVIYEHGTVSADYPDKNHQESVHDPAQAYNALVTGTYTRMDRIDQRTHRGVAPLASHGGMSPSNSTSVIWNRQWPIKPDIVMEGGNLGVERGLIRDDIHALKPLSLDKDFAQYIFTPFGDTSGAAALAAKMAAELSRQYSAYWPETIRGLIVHSAEWTNTMLNGLDLNRASIDQKQVLLRTYGYGVPILEKAIYSAGNALTLISEQTIQPYRLHEGSVQYNQYHLYDIPWPAAVLQNELTDADVKLKVTLSYFIEPNPGNRQYVNNFHYHSHSLDFRVIKPTEDPDVFRRRISKFLEGEEAPDFEGSEEPWTLKERTRNKGSVKKDFLVCSGADLSTRHTIAIIPKSGWYKTRKKLAKYNSSVRYSLIVSIETADVDVDLYTPVSLQIAVPVVIQV